MLTDLKRWIFKVTAVSKQWRKTEKLFLCLYVCCSVQCICLGAIVDLACCNELYLRIKVQFMFIIIPYSSSFSHIQ